jgi:DNA-binding XRE family transcriptional regulator
MTTKKNLTTLRIQAGLDTQQKLADAAGLNKLVIWNAENGKAISFTSATKIILALQQAGIDVKDVEEIEWNISKKRK